jgi:drug/metabolite transporter (DMT)-like permease
MALGIAAAVAACLFWGLTFVAPLLLMGFTPVEIAIGRFLAYGLFSAALLVPAGAAAWRGPARLWLAALALTLAANVGYYLLLIFAIRLAGSALPTLIIGVLPVSVAVAANVRSRELAWPALLLSCLLILAGIALVQLAGIKWRQQASQPFWYGVGVAAAVGALALWTWFAVANAAFLRHHPEIAPGAWATRLGVMTLPATILIVPLLAFPDFPIANTPEGGSRPAWDFVQVSLLVGIGATWVATWLWNRASQALPTSLAGQLLVFETVFGLAYAFMLEGKAPPPLAWAGMALLFAGVVLGIRAARRPSLSHA